MDRFCFLFGFLFIPPAITTGRRSESILFGYIVCAHNRVVLVRSAHLVLYCVYQSNTYAFLTRYRNKISPLAIYQTFLLQLEGLLSCRRVKARYDNDSEGHPSLSGNNTKVKLGSLCLNCFALPSPLKERDMLTSRSVGLRSSSMQALTVSVSESDVGRLDLAFSGKIWWEPLLTCPY
ncbi:hypothetical protein MLD38_038339 [Melastoma candidum]|uniref:Uncharacterized protein n=1 Tax=Melastoma candidum TaxID=119954 RepID=A0ACB9L035_9MYRT|nr:hypothetical protein MLD38_038339 [Melastoma candidum]